MKSEIQLSDSEITLSSRPTRRKVFLALKMAGIAGQDKLSGIFRFLGDDPAWDITLVRTAIDFTPARIRAALAEGFDGYIVSIPNTEPTAALLAESTVPTVVMDLHDPALSARTANIAFIRNSPEEIGAAAADHLLSTGRCRSYAFIHNPSVLEWSVARCRAFRERLRDYGLWVHEFSSPAELAQLERPIGIFAANDDCGYDVLEWCRAHRLRVPEDALVLGLNNDTLICEHCHPRLSSIQPDFEQEGYLAAQTLAQMMEKSTSVQPSTFNLQPSTLYVGVRAVIRRESTAELSHSGKLVQKALAYIQRNALRGISVADVVRHLKVSRRLADLRFRELQGTTIGETILQLRLEEVKRLLRSTKEPIESIASYCGYDNPNYLRNLFRKRFAMTMSEFRKSSGLNQAR